MSNQNDLSTEFSPPFNSGKPKNTRKRKINVPQRKQNKRKNKRQHGEEYITTNGTIKEAKTLKPPCESKCILDCTKNFSEILRKHIFETFWSLDDSQKGAFYNKFITRTLVKRRRAASKRKTYTFSYYFQKENLKVKVCKTFF